MLIMVVTFKITFQISNNLQICMMKLISHKWINKIVKNSVNLCPRKCNRITNMEDKYKLWIINSTYHMVTLKWRLQWMWKILKRSYSNNPKVVLDLNYNIIQLRCQNNKSKHQRQKLKIIIINLSQITVLRANKSDKLAISWIIMLDHHSLKNKVKCMKDKWKYIQLIIWIQKAMVHSIHHIVQINKLLQQLS